MVKEILLSPPSSPFRNNCLDGKTALVTGGGSGIGFEIAHQLLVHGCGGVVICGRRRVFLEKACALLTQSANNNAALNFAMDVRQPQQCLDAVKFAVDTFGRLDILVNGAAGNFLSEARALRPKGFQTVMEIDAIGTFNMSHAAFAALSKNGGTIINISATLQHGATWYQSHASAAKSAVDSLTRSLALEWGAYGVRVVGIAPGPIAGTPGTTKLMPDVDEETAEEFASEMIPLGRMGRKEEIGWAAVYLCSDAGSYITGNTLIVDGAQWLYKPPMIPREMIAELTRKVEGKSRAQGPGNTIIQSKL